MKKNIILFTLLLLSIGAFAQTRETRDVKNFSKVAFRIPGKLIIRQGAVEKLEIEGSKTFLKDIVTEVEGSKLTIHLPGKWINSWNNEKATIYLTVKNLDELAVSGSGDAVGESTFKTGELKLKVSGSGSLSLDVDASGEVEADVSGSGNLTIKGKSKSFNSDVSGSGKVAMDMDIDGLADFGISGSGKIEAKGKATKVKTSISGSGKVLAANLAAESADIRISGSGDVEVNVKDELNANISGSGSVSYKGNPSKVNSNSSGSGRVSKM